MNTWRFYLFLFSFFICEVPTLIAVEYDINIWQGTKVSTKKVMLHCMVPDEQRNIAVIVCPGGSYSWLDEEDEGFKVAKWLNTHGISAFVLKYRTQGVFSFATHSRLLFGGFAHPDPLVDIQMTIDIVRKQMKKTLGEDFKLGVMGFSAGGHLVMMSAIHADSDFLKSVGVSHTESLMPDFVASIYPVVTFSDERYVHKRSRRALLGEYGKRNPILRDSLSLEKHINSTCPPVFLMNCKDDPVVAYQNSLLLDSALTANNVNYKYILYNTGGHGFGASDSKGTIESRKWRDEFIKWLSQLN